MTTSGSNSFSTCIRSSAQGTCSLCTWAFQGELSATADAASVEFEVTTSKRLSGIFPSPHPNDTTCEQMCSRHSAKSGASAWMASRIVLGFCEGKPGIRLCFSEREASLAMHTGPYTTKRVLESTFFENVTIQCDQCRHRDAASGRFYRKKDLKKVLPDDRCGALLTAARLLLTAA